MISLLLWSKEVVWNRDLAIGKTDVHDDAA